MKKILFLTGTRADYGKLKSLIKKTEASSTFEPYLFATGMHLSKQHGMTVNEVLSDHYKNIYQYINQNHTDSMDVVLSKTINGLSDYVKEINPDLIIVHGDRVEALAGAIVGSLNNILVAHIEGGEVSGTIDELIRHSVSKMSHIHFVSNEKAKSRLLQLGEKESSVYVIGSPDLDIMLSPNLPTLSEVRKRYEIDFKSYAVLMYHPVTTEYNLIKEHIRNLVKAAVDSAKKFVVVYPNNDLGSKFIINAYEELVENKNFRVFPSLRFEYFLTLLKNADFIIGNSSAGIREMPFYGKPTINVGTRQNNRSNAKTIRNTSNDYKDILKALDVLDVDFEDKIIEFGDGGSDKLFFDAINSKEFWNIAKQKQFVDLVANENIKR